ncbi:amidase family protein [Candidatus Palauibacter polyketidifaciens]|uniref:amidase family protein n=1 Tax=Candidatus Palauibacter polyketidifaciens TaxID=3056740 RepID=UPI002385B072|nr:amidase family protein [Candidatus Palauibacter polyketidifaciens]MDE2720884.1 amidase family protein [Candidatus Palauibacter polyketidifaciens]
MEPASTLARTLAPRGPGFHGFVPRSLVARGLVVRHLIVWGLAFAWGASSAARLSAQTGEGGAAAFEVWEASIPELQAALESGAATSVDLVDAYIARIAAYDRAGPTLNAIIRLHPGAREQARRLDAERASGRLRGPLHGIPILLKDNYDTFDMPTAGSTVALAGWTPPDDAFQVGKLREAGAIILAKTNMHELAAGITSISSLGGQTRNPYDPARNPGGSSGGTGAAVAASFGAVGWGSDTCGSIRIPSSVHNLVGLRPTKGLSSIDGLIPLSHTQDTGGPLARSVVDLALALDATVGADAADRATEAMRGREPVGFLAALDAEALDGARIGALTEWLSDSGAEAPVTASVRAALDAMAAAGAEIVDVEIPDQDSLLTNTSVIGHEFALDLAAYLDAAGGAPVASLGDIVERGLHHEQLDGTFRRRSESGQRDEAAYAEALARQAALREAIVAFMDEERLDAIAYPTLRRDPARIGSAPVGGTCQLAAHSGLPAISAPAGFTRTGMPTGVELIGRPFDDARLVSFAYALERAIEPRRAPHRTPPLADGRAPEPLRFSVAGDGGWAGRPAAPRLQGSFSLDLPRGTLRYLIATSGLGPADAHAIVLQRRGSGTRPNAVVRRLSGPGHASAEGTLTLSAADLDDLLAGRFELALYTADRPLGAVRLPLDPRG